MKTLEEEISELKIIKNEWFNTNCDKSSARSLLSKVKLFNHTFNVKFKTAERFYHEDSFAEIDITDGIEDLEIYLKSKLKVKDDKYFYRSLNKFRDGLETLIFNLESK